MTKQLTQKDQRRMAHEATIRMSFDHDAVSLMESHTIQPVMDCEKILLDWVTLLEKQSPISKAFIIHLHPPTKQVHTRTPNPEIAEQWNQVLAEYNWDDLVEQIQHQRIQGYNVPENIDDHAILLISPCYCTLTPTALAVVVRRQTDREFHARWMLEQATLRAGVPLAIINAIEERERGRLELAGRVAHMTSSSLVLAQLRLQHLREGLDDNTVIASNITEVLGFLEEAQQGLDRARLLGIPWQQFSKKITLPDFLIEIQETLNDTTGNTIVNGITHLAHDATQSGSITVTASPVRLRYALRDLTLGAWVLSGQRKPVMLTLANGGQYAKLTIQSQDVSLHSAANQQAIDQQDLLSLLCDPAVFLISPDRYIPERSMGFYLAIHLIKEMGGDITAHIEKQTLTFEVSLPVMHTKG